MQKGSVMAVPGSATLPCDGAMTPSLQYPSCNHWLTALWTPLSTWLAICNRRRREASCHLATDTLTSIPSTPGIQSYVPRRDTCLKVNDDYEGVWCVPSATRVSWIHRSQNKFLSIRACRTLHFDIYSSPICTKCLKTGG